LEAEAVLQLAELLDDQFERAVDTVLGCQGKVIVTGMGKSGLVGQKIASTLSSTGTPAFFLQPAECSHGDLGVVARGDVVLAISYGGETEELNPILKFLARKDIALIAMTGRSDSTLGRAAVAVLNVFVREEACPLKLAPTSSSTATLALGDALAMAVLKERGFRAEDFAEFHPGGQLGRRILTRVKDVMHTGSALPLVSGDTLVRRVLSLMTAAEVRGVAGVVDEAGDLVGVITDGDVRRRLERSGQFVDDSAQSLMSRTPKTIDGSEMAERALLLMESFKIQSLFVIDKASPQPRRPVGLLHLQDLLAARVR
jgi:arabinose-5-phosphate isomerase